MRFRLLRRRLTISAPSMAISSRLPWPIKWIVAAVLLGFCAAIALWAFEFGKDLAGIDQGEKEQLAALKIEMEKTRSDRDKAQSIANVSNLTIATEKATQDKLTQQIKQLQTESQSLRDDLGFYERLIPTTTTEPLAIRGLQADVQPSNQVKWQVLVVQSAKNPHDFKGKIDVTVTGVAAGKSWSASLAGGAQVIDVKQFKRFDGLIDLPPQIQLKSITVKVMDNNAASTVRAVQTQKL